MSFVWKEICPRSSIESISVQNDQIDNILSSILNDQTAEEYQEYLAQGQKGGLLEIFFTKFRPKFRCLTKSSSFDKFSTFGRDFVFNKHL